jgi:hypothetical protein
MYVCICMNVCMNVCSNFGSIWEQLTDAPPRVSATDMSQRDACQTTGIPTDMSQKMPVKLQVFRGTADDLAAVLGPHVDRGNFFFPEKVTDTNIEMIWKVRPLWRALHFMNDNFSFQATKLQGAMAIIWEERRDTWPSKLSDEHKDGWVFSVTNRLLAALSESSRAIQSTGIRERWLQQVLLPALRPEDSAAAEQAAPSGPGATTTPCSVGLAQQRRQCAAGLCSSQPVEKGDDRRLADEASQLWESKRGPLWTGTLGNSGLRLYRRLESGREVLRIKKCSPQRHLHRISVNGFCGDLDARRNQAMQLGVSLCEQLQSGTLPASTAAIQNARKEWYDCRLSTEQPAAKKQRTQGTEAGKEQGAEKQLRMRPAAEEQEEEEEEEKKPLQKKPLQKRPAGTGARSSGKLPVEKPLQTRLAGKGPAKEQEEEPAASAYENYLRALARERFHTDQIVARTLHYSEIGDRMRARRCCVDV